METPKVKNVKEYILSQPIEIQLILEKVRETIIKAEPQAVESIAYAMPVYKLKGKPLIYFGAAKNHLGVYATPSAHEAFKVQLSIYKQGKGSVQFPFNLPIPYDLINEMVKYKALEIKNNQTSKL